MNANDYLRKDIEDAMRDPNTPQEWREFNEESLNDMANIKSPDEILSDPNSSEEQRETARALLAQLAQLRQRKA